jgi:hypothetical protein
MLEAANKKNAYIQIHENRFKAKKRTFIGLFKRNLCCSLRGDLRTKTFHHQLAGGTEYDQALGHFFPYV